MWTNKEFVAFKIATARKFGENFSIFSTPQSTDVSFGSQFHSSTGSKCVAFKIAAKGKFDSNLFIFAYFKPNYSFFFIEISLTWTNKDFVTSKLPIFSNVFFFGSQFQSRLVQNLLPSKLPRTIHSIQNFQCLRILNPTTLSFSLKFHLCRPIKNLLLPSKLPRTVNRIQIFQFLPILNPTILSFSLKFRLRGQIKNLLPS
jgi:hypothetical protein